LGADPMAGIQRMEGVEAEDARVVQTKFTVSKE
jgi:hypothetical protein